MSYRRPHTYYLGAVLEATGAIDPAPVPSNFKDPEKIAAKQAELAKAARQKAAGVVTAGTLAAFVLLDDGGREVASADGAAGDEPPSIVLARMLQHYHPGFGRVGEPAAPDCQFRLVGFEVRAALRVALVDAAAYAASETSDAVPIGLLQQEHLLVDPYRLLVATEDRPHVSVHRLLGYFGLASSDQDFLFADRQARLAHKLCEAAQFFRLPG